MNSHEVFIHIHQGCFAGTGAIVRLPQCQWSKPDGYGKISQCITTTKHSKAKTVCIFLGIYCKWTVRVYKEQDMNIYIYILYIYIFPPERLSKYMLLDYLKEHQNGEMAHSHDYFLRGKLNGVEMCLPGTDFIGCDACVFRAFNEADRLQCASDMSRSYFFEDFTKSSPYLACDKWCRSWMQSMTEVVSLLLLFRVFYGVIVDPGISIVYSTCIRCNEEHICLGNMILIWRPSRRVLTTFTVNNHTLFTHVTTGAKFKAWFIPVSAFIL